MKAVARLGAMVLALVGSAAIPAQESAARFDAPVLLSANANFVPISALPDLNGDTVPDAAGALSTGAAVQLALWSNSGGAFTAFWSTSIPDPSLSFLPPAIAAGSIGVANGLDDVAVSSGTTVQVYLSAGFVAPTLLASFIETAPVRALLVRDFDGDGKGDVAVLTDAEVRVHFHAAGTVFTSAAFPLAATASPSVMIATDIDGNGLPDVVLVETVPGGTARSILVSPAALTGGAALIHGIAGPSPVAGDIDGDGDEDIVIFGTSQYRVLRRFGPAVYVPEAALPGGPATVLADIDGDGDRDACWAANDGICTLVLGASRFNLGLNDGTGAFAPPFSIRSLRGSINSSTPAERLAGAVDVDGDGDIDLVAGNAIYYARGAIVAPPPATLAGFSTQPAGILDADNDGDLDVGFQWGGPYWRNLGNGTGAAAIPLLLAPPPAGSTFVGPGYPGDWDADGDCDLIVERRAGATFQSMRLLLGAAGGLIDGGDAGTNPGVAFSTFVPLDASAMLRADADGDGDQDLVLRPVTWNERWTHVWRNDGTGHFSFGASVDAYVHALADFNGDGLPDALGTTYNDLVLLPGLPGGGFAGPMVVLYAALAATNPQSFRESLIIGDFSGDGLPDVMAGQGGSLFGSTVYLLNTGAGTFASLPPSSLPQWAGLGFGRAIVADIDADGWNDILTAPTPGTGSCGIAISRKTGMAPGAWAPPVIQAVEGSRLADMDGDGDLDVVGTGITANTRWHGAAAGSRFEYASGFSGTGGLVPTLGIAGVLRPGFPSTLRFAGGPAGAAGVLVIGDQPASTPLLGAIQYTNIVLALPFTTSGSGGAPWLGSFALPLAPAPPSVAGLSAYLQAGIADPAGPMGISRTNALRVTFGF